MNYLIGGSSRAITSARLVACGRSLSISSKQNQEFRDSEDLAKERYDMRANEEVEKKRARLLYQSRKRGMLENGVILASFADKYLKTFNPEQLDTYDRLINLPTNDWDIFHWATNTKPTPPEFETTVMKDLREHIKSKVSNKVTNVNTAGNDYKKLEVSVLGKTRPDDIVLPTLPKEDYPLDIDPSRVSLVDYKYELFDDRTRRLKGNKHLVNMTDWRREYFVRRLRRTISSPISLRNLSEDKQVDAFSQRSTRRKSIASENIVQKNLLESPRDRALKHHDFLQFLMQSEFTDNPLDYDDESEAWSEMIWRRNYGFADVKIAPSQIKCTSCRAKLHCCEPGLDGYMPKELFAKITSTNNPLCQRCKFSQTYDASLGKEVSREDYEKFLYGIQLAEPSIICLLVDLTDFPSGLYEDLLSRIGNQHRVLIVGNKLDLLPIDGPHFHRRVLYSLKKNLSKLRPGNPNLFISDVILMSARTGFGIDSLVTRLLALSEEPRDVYLLGSSNSGKSTLFNALAQSDLSKIREGDIISRVSIFESLENIELKMLKFPINTPDNWEVHLKKRKMERIERDEPILEKSLQNAVEFRQANTLHTSILIDRFEYKPISKSDVSSEAVSETQISKTNETDLSDTQLKFSLDHPLKIHEDKFKRKPLSATSDEFPQHGFFHQTPSVNTGDQLHELLTTEERLEVFPNETMVPRNYSIRPLQSIFIAGLARLDLLTSNSNVIFTICVSKYLPIHVVPTRKADKFYYTFLGSTYLGVPVGDHQRLRSWPQLKSSQKNFVIKGRNWNQGSSDIVLSSLGWAMVRVSPDQECIVRAYTPGGRGISYRNPPLLCYAHRQDGKKIRDTPLFLRQQFSNEQTPASAWTN